MKHWPMAMCFDMNYAKDQVIFLCFEATLYAENSGLVMTSEIERCL